MRPCVICGTAPGTVRAGHGHLCMPCLSDVIHRAPRRVRKQWNKCQWNRGTPWGPDRDTCELCGAQPDPDDQDGDRFLCALCSFFLFTGPSPRPRVRPWERRLFITEGEIMALPYLREGHHTSGAPWTFTARSHVYGHQALIVGVAWVHDGPYQWHGAVYWLKDYDAPYSDRFYTGLEGGPCEAVSPSYVLEVVRGDRAPWTFHGWPHLATRTDQATITEGTA